MKNRIVEDGLWRLAEGQKELSLGSMYEKYAAEISKASPAQKFEIERRALEEFLRRKNHKPSAGALW